MALDTKFFGLENNCSHKATLKNKKCGDIIKIELKIKKNKIYTMRYETESCIFCQATASLLARKINIFNPQKLKKDIDYFYKNIQGVEKKLPSKYKIFKDLFNNKNINRIDCIMLPFNALIKALEFKI